MTSQTVLSIVAAAAFIGACATEPEKPAPAPAPAPVAAPKPVPAPPPPAPAPVAKPEPKPEPKKPAVINLASTELFEFNKATLTADARGKLDAEVVAKLKDLGDIRYVNVNGQADRMGSPQYNQRLSEERAVGVSGILICRGSV